MYNNADLLWVKLRIEYVYSIWTVCIKKELRAEYEDVIDYTYVTYI